MQTLLLDRNYMALSIITWKRAMKLLVSGKAEVIEKGKMHVKSERAYNNVPSVLRLLVYTPYKATSMHRVRFSRNNVLIRDGYKCRYCGVSLSKHSVTIDHVLPKSRGGETSYENCVAACRHCNDWKADKTLKEAGMTLNYIPKKPTFWELYVNSMKNTPEEWRRYMLC